MNESSTKPKNLMSKEMQIKLPTLLFSQQKIKMWALNNTMCPNETELWIISRQPKAFNALRGWSQMKSEPILLRDCI